MKETECCRFRMYHNHLSVRPYRVHWLTKAGLYLPTIYRHTSRDGMGRGSGLWILPGATSPSPFCGLTAPMRTCSVPPMMKLSMDIHSQVAVLSRMALSKLYNPPGFAASIALIQ